MYLLSTYLVPQACALAADTYRHNISEQPKVFLSFI